MQTQTIGSLLARADATFQTLGGYRAIAHCEARHVDLIERTPTGIETIVATAPFPAGVAGEDIARDLLCDRIGIQAADDTYFVITFV